MKLVMTAIGVACCAACHPLSAADNTSQYASIEPDIRQAIEGSCLKSVAPTQKDNCLTGPHLIIKVVKSNGLYAMATVARASDPDNFEGAYLKLENGHWLLLDEGTGMNPEELGIPPEMR